LDFHSREVLVTDVASRLATALADRYRIERQLGAGGMATVYRAHDVKHDRDVAIKILHPDLSESLGRDRFLREIRLAARLNHPHILPLHDSGEAQGLLYFVMPVMEGQSLRDRLEQERPLPVDDAVRIASEVADALDYAHRHDVVHRDIKPENILLHEGHAVVADFGIGKALVAAATDAAAFTQTGVTVGTPAYMSPEQAAGEAVDGRSDLYALGCVLYEMLTGEAAFTGSTAAAVIAKRFLSSPPPVTDLRPTVPPAISAAVARMLERAPAERHTSGAQVVAALRSLEAPAAAPAPAPRDTSLVVLPFVNTSADPENEYFADGLTEELITDLARIRALRVISRTSSMQLKGTAKGIRAIGRELGVRYALEGSVRKAGASLRITAQLIDTQSDARLWADKYSGTIDDVFDLQERVSRAIVEALDVTLSTEEDARLTDRPIANVRAFELFLRARQEIRHYQVERGVVLLEHAIEIEGEVPILRALRALALVTQVRSGMNRDLQPLAQAEAEARALIEIAPQASYGYALLGYIDYERGELREAVRSLSAALDRDPTDADVHFFLGISLIGAGQTEATAQAVRRITATDPLSPMTPTLAGVATWFVGRAGEGVQSMERALQMDPESVINRWTMGYHYALVGRIADAATQAEWMHQHVPLMPYTVQLRALVAALEGRSQDALQLLARVDTAALDGHHRFHLAEAFAMAGDCPRALALVAQAVDTSFYPHDFIARHTPFMAPLRGTPEFERITAKAARRVAEFKA
jgi:serine/threonine protein kinase/thioredoxin-like negative regulator of GroEL